MIYFDSKTREILANKLYKFIEHGGYLFIGHSESLDKNTSKFKYIGNAIYYKE
jgi:chemotaxis protein methyltransferase CheR